MRSLTYRRFGILSFLMLTINLLPCRAYTQQVWFAPGDDLSVNGVVSQPDYMRLFEDPATWPVGVAHIQVMQLRAPWVLRNSPEKWQKATNFLAGHHIAIAMPMGLWVRSVSGTRRYRPDGKSDSACRSPRRC